MGVVKNFEFRQMGWGSLYNDTDKKKCKMNHHNKHRRGYDRKYYDNLQLQNIYDKDQIYQVTVEWGGKNQSSHFPDTSDSFSASSNDCSCQLKGSNKLRLIIGNIKRQVY